MADPDLNERRKAEIALYTAYLEDLGRIGGRHEESRKFYISVISALFVFLSMAGPDGFFVNVRGAVVFIVGIVGVMICFAWFEHMRSFGALYAAKLDTLRELEAQMAKAKAAFDPFTKETLFLKRKPPKTPFLERMWSFLKRTPKEREWGYNPLTFVDRIAPVACSLLFVALLVVKL